MEEHGFFGQKIFGVPIFFAQLKKGENFPPEKKDVKYEDEIGFVIVLVVAVDIYRYIYIYARLKSRSGKHWREIKSLSL